MTHDIRPRTGDLVLFASRAGCCTLTTLVRLFIRRLYLLHSPHEPLAGFPDLVTGREKDGPQLVPLRPYLAAVSDDVYLRRVRWPGRASPERWAPALAAFVRSAVRLRYERDVCELLRSAVDCCGTPCLNRPDATDYFCSELVADAWIRAGVTAPRREGTTPSNEYVPADFAEDGREPVDWAPGVRWLDGEPAEFVDRA